MNFRKAQSTPAPSSAAEKAASLVPLTKTSPTSIGGMSTPSERNSVEKTSVAAPCSTNSTPPVASTWLIGGEVSSGRTTSKCSSTPNSAMIGRQAAKASHSGQPSCV